MTRIADRVVIIQTSSEAVPSPPSWFGEIVLRASHQRPPQVLTNNTSSPDGVMAVGLLLTRAAFFPKHQASMG